MIHPFGEHVCQCCGRSLSIFYEYPTKYTIRRLQKKLTLFAKLGPVAPADYSIYEIIDRFCRNQVEINYVAAALDLPPVRTKEELKELIRSKCAYGSTRLSPGVMCNPPDRYDGCHSDGVCCREKTDRRRWRQNMQTYTQDRRAYEEWSDGN